MVDDVSSFWGPVTSTIESCEKNYIHSSYIAEFYNTLSNVPGLLLALFGLINVLRQRFEKRFCILFISNMIIFIGSMFYHATLQDLQEQSDETPMVWEKLVFIYILYSPHWQHQATMPIFLFLYGVVFATAHGFLRFGIGFKVHYMILSLICMPRMYKYYTQTEDISAKRIAKWCDATSLVGTICWFCDWIFCKAISQWIVNPQGHALSHVLMGFSSYFANTFFMFCRAQQREWNPSVKYYLGVLPYVTIEKPKTE